MTDKKLFMFLVLIGYTAVLQGQSVDTVAAHAPVIYAEKLYVRTDKNHYLAGEMLWWKLYYTDGYFNRPASLSKVAYIEVLDDANKPVLQAKAALHRGGGDGSFFLPPELPSGNYILRAYTNWMKNFGADDFFSKHITVVNARKSMEPAPGADASAKQQSLTKEPGLAGHHLAIGVTSDATVYRSRTEVSMSVSTGSSPASVSIAVYRADSLTDEASANIENALWSRRPPSKMKDAQKDLPLEYVPEFDGHLITGVVRNTAGKPAADRIIYLSIPAAHGQYYTGRTDSAGRFKFDVRNYYGPGKIVLQTEDGKLSDYPITVTDPFSKDTTKPFHSVAFTVPDTLSSDQTREAIDMQVQNIYWSQQLSKLSDPHADSLTFYGNHYVNYNLDDYVRFTTVEEVLREYVLEVNVRKREGHRELAVIDYVSRGFFVVKPLILLDGVPLSEEQILNYDPMKIKSLRVCAALYHYGEFFYGGVISFLTYNGAAETAMSDPQLLIMDYDGFQVKQEFLSPQYKTAEQAASRVPDFRRSLYWNPDVQTDNTGGARIHFYTSDIKGRFLVVAEGIDERGNAGSSTYTFEVR